MPRQIASIGRSRSVGRAQQRELVLVGRAVDVRAEQRMRLLPVGRGVEVGAAAEEQAVEAVEQRLDVVDEAVGGEHDGDRSRLLQRLRVGQAQRQPGGRAVALASGRAQRPRRGRAPSASSCVTMPISGGRALAMER